MAYSGMCGWDSVKSCDVCYFRQISGVVSPLANEEIHLSFDQGPAETMYHISLVDQGELSLDLPGCVRNFRTPGSR